jgi:MFS family permease
VEITGLNLLMALIAWKLPDDRAEAARARAELAGAGAGAAPARRPRVEWRVVALSALMTLITFGYGSLTSFAGLFADELHIAPRSIYLTVMAAAILLGRLTIGRMIDSIGHRRVLVSCLGVPALGLLMLGFAQGRTLFLLSAVVYGAGFSLMYPSYTAYIIEHVPPTARGAAFGAMLAAFDSGIGAGASVMGWLIHNYGYHAAYFVAAGLAALSLPYFLVAERRLGFHNRIALPVAPVNVPDL